MSDTSKISGLQLRSLITKGGELQLSLAKVELPEPGPDQVLVKVEATPINPSDLGLLLGPADLTTAKASGSGDGITVTAKVPAATLPFLATRLDESMPVGNEGAGTVVKAGSSDAAQALKGKTVSMIGGAMYAQYRLLKATDCQPLPDGTTAAEGASWFVNPLTALGMTETMKREGHRALVYGSLDTSPVELTRNYGMAWGVGGWLLTPFLQKIGRPDQIRLRERVVKSLKTTFASHYTMTVSLQEALDLKNIGAYAKRATGEKFLINPNKG